MAQLRSSTETILTVMNDSLVQMALDPELQSFSDRYELLDIFDREELYQRLYQFRAVNRFIEKLSIHYYVNNMVLDLNGKDSPPGTAGAGGRPGADCRRHRAYFG